jgi:hypothetical protein
MTRRKDPADKLKVGRKSKYLPEFAEKAYKLCLLSAKDSEIADFFEIPEQTLNQWKRAHPEFREALARGKIAADANVAKSLYKRACGYSHPDVVISTYRGEVTITPITRHYPPDTQAASLWLRNRHKDKWRDSTNMEVTGAGGGPILLEQITMVAMARLQAEREEINPEPQAIEQVDVPRLTRLPAHQNRPKEPSGNADEH